jgi:hypothetical protein
MHAGSCHCGAVKFAVTANITELTTCNCSLCSKRNALMAKVPEAGLTVLAGEAALTLYQWNTRRAKHYFCRHCGIYVFHRKRSQPDHFGVNVFCLQGVDTATIPIRAADGAAMSLEAPPAASIGGP